MNVAWKYGVLCATVVSLRLPNWRQRIKYHFEQFITMCKSSLSYPIEAIRGRHHSGIKIPNWYKPNPNAYTPAQMELLMKLKSNLTGNDLAVMASIIDQSGE